MSERERPFRDHIYYDEEQFPTTPLGDTAEQGAWACSYCGEASKRRRGIKHDQSCCWYRKRKP